MLSTKLSDATRSVWAKFDRGGDGWLPLWRHMADSGAVAGLLWDRWVPHQVQRIIVEALPSGPGDARRLVAWAAAVHDIGKATPAFACQVGSLADTMRDNGLRMPPMKLLSDRNLAPHGLAGLALLREWLMDRYGWTKRSTLPLVVVVGGHHGVPPTYSAVDDLDRHPELLRTPECESSWRTVQYELLDSYAETYEVADRLYQWRDVRLPQSAQVILTALVIVADWIASNSDLFPYFPDGQGTSDQERIAAAWHGLDLPRPWRAVRPTKDVDALFAARLPLPPGARVRPVQKRAVEMAQAMERPGMLVIEAPMGEGKTEAALAVAEVFAAQTGAGGCFVALPTMATGNAMFPRMLQWLRRVPSREGSARSVVLAHSKAALNEDFTGLVRAGRRAASGVALDADEDEWRPLADRLTLPPELVAHQWLRGKKKALLASFGVGTIDQLLFMGLKSRHLALRHLALAGKVVIIDEAHAYDTYMNSYLDRVLSWLGRYGVPVVVLSATLPAERRRELAEAYAPDVDGAQLAKVDGYPLLTAVTPAVSAVARPVGPSGRRTDVHMERLDDDLAVLADRLADELADGGCVLVVRNTVDRVLETAAYLRKRFGRDGVTVAHARFVDLDRLAKDADLLRRFGPTGEATDRPTRPHVVVASQVAEQSLDIDFDLLVSDLCPIDLLLQRMGRLHRHIRTRPRRLEKARCLVTGADWDATPVAPVSGSRRVYRTYALLRSAAVLAPYLSGTAATGNTVRLPEDISPLIEQAYGERPVGPATWQQALAEARRRERSHRENQRQKAEDFQLGAAGRDGSAILGWVDAGVGDADDTRKGRAQVRDGTESLEVLVVQRRAVGSLRTVPWLADGKGGLDLPIETAPEKRLARIVAACGLRLPFQLCLPGVIHRVIEELEADGIPAWQDRDCHWLAGELVLILDENCRARLAGYELSYTPDDGLEVSRAE